MFCEDNDEVTKRRNAELEFVSSAYAPEEASWRDIDGLPSIHRRLVLPLDEIATSSVVLLVLTMPSGYPTQCPLDISGTVVGTSSNKSGWNALPHLLEVCREVAAAAVGEEAVLSVLSRADEWVQEEWPHIRTFSEQKSKKQERDKTTLPSSTILLGRRLIYSHHIISKSKRASIKELASHYTLTGYMKTGWPGILLIEGKEQDCIDFYDTIRSMSWKYLVVRGEQQVEGGKRKFASFVETDDMSIVANHCREVGLEALFRTSMKVYDGQLSISDEETTDHATLCGALVHVDHMNDGKQYRKWLRRTSRQLDCFILIKQCYQDCLKRPLIIVGIVGVNVSEFMKRWRASRVDVDSKGRPCFERQMTVVVDGPLDSTGVEELDWDRLNAEEHFNLSLDQLKDIISSVGGPAWTSTFEAHTMIADRFD